MATVGFDATKLPGKAQRNSGYAFCQLKALGVELAFDFHTVYRPSFGEPKDNGKAILYCIFVYPNGHKSQKIKPYEGAIPFSGEPVRTRGEALRIFGTPYETQEGDGQIDLDHWRQGDLQVTATHRSDRTISHLGLSIPYIGSRG